MGANSQIIGNIFYSIELQFIIYRSEWLTAQSDRNISQKIKFVFHYNFINQKKSNCFCLNLMSELKWPINCSIQNDSLQNATNSERRVTREEKLWKGRVCTIKKAGWTGISSVALKTNFEQAKAYALTEGMVSNRSDMEMNRGTTMWYGLSSWVLVI